MRSRTGIGGNQPILTGGREDLLDQHVSFIVDGFAFVSNTEHQLFDVIRVDFLDSLTLHMRLDIAVDAALIICASAECQAGTVEIHPSLCIVVEEGIVPVFRAQRLLLLKCHDLFR